MRCTVQPLCINIYNLPAPSLLSPSMSASRVAWNLRWDCDQLSKYRFRSELLPGGFLVGRGRPRAHTPSGLCEERAAVSS